MSVSRLISLALPGSADPSLSERQHLRVVLLAVYAIATCLLTTYTALVLVPHGDWNVWAQVPARLEAGTLYEHSASYTWAWSPLASWLIAAVVVPIGPWAWAALHFGALALLRDARLILLVAASYPFWLDTLIANTFTFSAVAGYVAWRGNRLAAVAYLALLVLMPRPVLVPLAALLLWRDRRLWLPFAAIAAVGIITTLSSGYLIEWGRVLLSIGREYPSQEFNLSPTRFLGPAWLIVGIPLAAVLTWRRRPGWAGLAVSPYIVPQYLLVLLLEVRSSSRGPWLQSDAHRQPSVARQSHESG